jgi:hypothetical protein
VADKPVLVIDVDTSQFDAFEAKFQAYTEAVQASPAAWGETDKAVKEVGTSFDAALGEMLKMNAAMIDPNLGKAFTGIQALSIGTSKAWRLIAQDSEKSLKSMSGMARLAAGLSTFGVSALGGVLAIGGAAAAATIGTAKDLSDENRQNRELGLPSGEAKAFEDQYGPSLGASDSDLARIADIKNNQGEWSKLINATNGKVNYENIQKDDPVELYLKSVRAAGETYRDMGPAGGQWAESQGANALFGSGTVRNASTRDDSFWNKQHQQYTEERDKIAIGQPALDQSTAFEEKWKSDLTVLKRDFEGAIVPLEPIFIKLATGGTKIIDAFAKSPDLEKNINGIVSALETAWKDIDASVKWFDKNIAPLMPSLGKGGDKVDDAAIDTAKEAAKLLTDKSKWDKLVDAVLHPKFGKDAKPEPAHIDAKHPFGMLNKKEATPEPEAAKPAETSPWDSKHPFGTKRKKDAAPEPDGTAPKTSADNKDSFNVGNLRKPGSKTEFQTFDSKEAGVRGMDTQLDLYFKRDKLMTEEAMIKKYAPSNENNTEAYISDVEKRTGIKRGEELKWDDPDVRSKVESAMIQHESPNYRELTADAVRKILGGSDAPKGPTQADVDRASKAGDSKAADDSSSAPNGYPFKNPAPSTQMAPIALNLNVVAPAGSNVFTSLAGMALV